MMIDMCRCPKVWVIVASGPSAKRKDVAYAEERARVIAVNTSFQLLNRPGHVYAADGPWWSLYADEVRSAGHIGWTQDAAALVHHRLAYVACADREGLGREPGPIHGGKNSGYQAINLAFRLGARKIVLIGFDMRVVNGAVHWHGDHPYPLRNRRLYEQWAPGFRALARDLTAEGVEVVNCTPGSAIDAFPIANISEAL